MSHLRPHQTRPVPLSELAAGLGLSGDVGSAVAVTDVTLDSRDVRPGSLYVALPGNRVHGAQFAAGAAAAGAVAILTDQDGEPAARSTGLPVLVSNRLRPDMAVVAARAFGSPADGLTLVGVTGTNGKTTTVALLEAAFREAGRRVGTVGTIGFRLDGQALPSARGTVTTPDSPDLQALLAAMAEQGADAVALEVSSHAMVHHRVDGLVFDVTAFLNLGRDHLDFHKDMADYFEAKASLFTPEHTRHAVVWTDDEHGAEVARRARAAGLPVTTVGSDGADYRLSGYEATPPLGGRARVTRGGEELEVRIGLPGRHNMIDAVVALAMLEVVGVPTQAALAGLSRAQVPGRMQVVELGEGAPTVVVDFAHTPQAVAATLDALRPGFERMVVVLGCGGDRDPSKRPEMGAAAASRADVLVVTDDNPRSEDPAAIRAAVLAGVADVETARDDLAVLEVAGRRAAIERAVAMAGDASVVAILGKGHEQGQIVGDRVIPFDDAVEAQAAWGNTAGGTR